MKVALIIKDLRHCGAQRAIARLSFVLRDAGLDVFMILLTNGDIDYQHAGELIVINSPIRKGLLGKLITTFQRTRELKMIKKKYAFDAAISFLDTPNISNLLTREKEKVYVSVRNYKSLEDKGIFNILNRVMIKSLYKKADKVIVVSEAIFKDMAKNYNVPENKMRVIYNPFEVDQIIKQSKEKLDDKYLDFYKDHKVIVSVGRLCHQKGFWNLIKAFFMIRKKYEDLRVVLVGDGDQEKPLLELARDLGVDKDILFVGYQKNPFAFIRKAHIYAMTSLFEGFPNSLVEAMICGTPVVSTDCMSGPREILYRVSNVNDNTDKIELAEFGVLCPAFSKEDGWEVGVFSNNQIKYAEALKILISDTSLYSDYSQKGLERAKDFSFEKCKQQYLEMLEG